MRFSALVTAAISATVVAASPVDKRELGGVSLSLRSLQHLINTSLRTQNTTMGLHLSAKDIRHQVLRTP